MRQNGPKTAGKRAQNGGRGSGRAATLLKLVSEGSCAGRSHWAGRKVGVLGRFGVNFSRFSSANFGREPSIATQRPRNGHVTGV